MTTALRSDFLFWVGMRLFPTGMLTTVLATDRDLIEANPWAVKECGCVSGEAVNDPPRAAVQQIASTDAEQGTALSLGDAECTSGVGDLQNAAKQEG